MLVRMFDKRLRGYRAIGYTRSSTPIESRELDDTTATDDGDHLEPDDATT